MRKMSLDEREIRYMYEVEDFSDTIRNEGPLVVRNGFEKCSVENIEEIKDIDPLHASKVQCRLCDILFVAFAAVICQVKSYAHMAILAESHADWLRQYTQLPEGKTRSRGTFRRVLSMLNPEFLKNTFQSAVLRLIDQFDPSIDTSHIAMDGKSVAGYYTQSHLKFRFSAEDLEIFGDYRTQFGQIPFSTSKKVSAFPEKVEKIRKILII